MAKNTILSVTQVMRFKCALLFVFLTALGRIEGQSIFHNATEALKGWDDLATEAGYFTDAGRWKGGLPRRHRSTNHEAYTCDRTHPDAGFCLRWSGGIVPESGPVTTETCNCTFHEDNFCQEWECRRAPDDAPCRRTSLACIEDRETRITNCICESGAVNENPICQEWSCQEYSIFGNEQSESFVCLHEDVSGNFCYRWRGNTTSSSHIKSAVCDCFNRSERHCNLWLCQEREIRRCAVLDHGMCDTGFAVGVYGGFGMVFLLGSIAYAFFTRKLYENKEFQALAGFCIGFLVLVLPWMIGAALTGGEFAIGWVCLLWGVPIFFATVYVISTSKNVRKKTTSCFKPAAN